MEAQLDFVWLTIAGFALVIFLLCVLTGIDEMFGIPVVSSALGGFTAGATVYAISGSVWVSSNVGTIVGVLIFLALKRLRENLTSTDLNE